MRRAVTMRDLADIGIVGLHQRRRRAKERLPLRRIERRGVNQIDRRQELANARGIKVHSKNPGSGNRSENIKPAPEKHQ
jgi:hypothetical protein